MSSWAMWANIGFSLAFFIFLYKFVPLYLATWFGHIVPARRTAVSASTWSMASSGSRCFSAFCS